MNSILKMSATRFFACAIIAIAVLANAYAIFSLQAYQAKQVHEVQQGIAQQTGLASTASGRQLNADVAAMASGDAAEEASALDKLERHHAEEMSMASLFVFMLSAFSIGTGIVLFKVDQQNNVLEKNNVFTQVVLNSVAAELVVVDRAGIIRAVNEPWLRFSIENSPEPGVPAPNTAIGANYFGACCTDCSAGSNCEASDIMAPIRRVLAGELPHFEQDYRCDSPTEKRWFRMTVLPLGEGKCDGVVITHADISKNVFQQMELETERKRLSDIIEATNSGTWEWNLQTGIKTVSAQWARLLGYTLDEVMPVNEATRARFYHPDDLKAANRLMQRHFAGELAYYDSESRMRHKDGHWVWIRHIGKLISRTPDGRPLMIAGVVQDISERKNSERKLQEAELLLRSSIETIGEGFVIYDPSDRLVYCNDEYRDFYRTSAEIIQAGRTFEEIIRYGAERGQYAAAIGRVDEWVAERMRIHRRGNQETVQKLDDGRWLKIRECLTSSGHIVGFRVDITEFYKAKEAAEAANQAKDAFLANISHELRTPLNGVIGMANLARGMSSEPRQRDYLEKIISSGKHLNGVINDLLDLSKIAAGHLEFEDIDFSLAKMVERTKSITAPLAAEKGLKLIHRIDADVPDTLRGDPLRIKQIVLNLLSNAIKFTDSGEVVLSIGAHEIEEKRACLDIEVRDTGMGMSSEQQSQLFRPFSQADSSISRKFGGTGLGLAISQHLARVMKGEITVSSAEGVGTSFRVRIWVGLGDAETVTSLDIALNESPVTYRDAHVLVAEDQPLNREIIESLLNAVDLVPTMVQNGQEAIDVLMARGADAFDLVLMDIQMPVLDGLTATRSIRDRQGFDALPIVALTAHTMKHEIQKSFAAGMNDHIGKPFDNAAFFQTLAKWIPAAKRRGAAEASQEAVAGMSSPARQNSGLAALTRFDTKNGIARFSGDEKLYIHWLNKFNEETTASLPQIREDFANSRQDRLRQTLHSLKGKSGMLGITDLHLLADEMEKSVLGGEFAEPMLAGLEQEIERVSQELCAVFTTST